MKEKVYNLLSNIYSSINKSSGPGLDSEMIAGYNAARSKPGSKHICHAPFSNMYFNVHGDCAPCWLTFLEPDSYPAKSVHDIWFGEKLQTLRTHLKKYDLTHKCNVCLKNLQTGNFTSVLARAYDVNEIREYPTMLELEVSNTCNLECVMCIGELSSSIRKNREKLPPLKSPYDKKFAEQLEEFIPHLKELRFNGGEPFLIDLVFTLFEKVEKLNPKLKIVIATNGTTVNNKVKNWLSRLNIHINFSLDSLTPEIYETIRVNAKFNRVIEHFHFFKEYTKSNNRVMCVMVNPMRNNWHEMPEFIRFVNKHNVNIWFNTIHRPADWAIWSLPHSELKNVYNVLHETRFSKVETANSLAAYNQGIYNNLVNVQIKNWLREAEERERQQIPETETIDEDEAKKIMEKNMTDFIYAGFNEGEEQKKHRIEQLFKKLEQIHQLLKERNGEINFYRSVFQTPADILYTTLDSKSVNALVENFEIHMLQQSPH